MMPVIYPEHQQPSVHQKIGSNFLVPGIVLDMCTFTLLPNLRLLDKGVPNGRSKSPVDLDAGNNKKIEKWRG
jgi:hypothetical protein